MRETTVKLHNGTASVWDLLNYMPALGFVSAKLLGKGCFAAGTPLLTPDGHKRIEDFRVGDSILSRHEDDPDGKLEVQHVEAIFIRQAQVFHLHLGGQVIGTTAEHPFYVKNKGWVPARALAVGDELGGHDGKYVAIEEVFDTGAFETVYNVRVSEYHTYFVGEIDWTWSAWAHNAYQINVGEFPDLLRAKQGERTTGILFWIDPNTGKQKWVELLSGPENATNAGLAGARNLPGATWQNWHHIEFQSLELMRIEKIENATLTHNWWKGDYPFWFCAKDNNLSRSLANGSILELADRVIYGIM